jgi:hypothetical protein
MSKRLLIDCDRLWTRLVTLVYRLRRKPRVTNRVPPLPAHPPER